MDAETSSTAQSDESSLNFSTSRMIASTCVKVTQLELLLNQSGESCSKRRSREADKPWREAASPTGWLIYRGTRLTGTVTVQLRTCKERERQREKEGEENEREEPVCCQRTEIRRVQSGDLADRHSSC